MISFQGVLLGVGGLLIVGPRAANAHERHHGVQPWPRPQGMLFGVCNVAPRGALRHWSATAACIGARQPLDRGRAGRPRLAAFYASARSLQDGEAVFGHRDHRYGRLRSACIAGSIVSSAIRCPAPRSASSGQAVAFVS